MALWHYERLTTFLSYFLWLDSIISKHNSITCIILVAQLILMTLEQLKYLFERLQTMTQTSFIDLTSRQDRQFQAKG